MHRIVKRLLATAAVTAGLVACGADDPTVDGDAAAGTGVDVRRGEALYGNNCAKCHGTDLRGTDQGPPHLDIVYEPSHHSDVAFQLAVQRGVAQHHWNFGPMPPIPGLDEADIADITAYVREQQRAAGIE